VGGALAALAAWGGMLLLRATLQIRSVPERVMDGLLLVIPIELFEASLQRFGFEAKNYALYGATVGTLVILTALGWLALRRAWPPPSMVALGLSLWFFATGILLPITGAGFLGLALVYGTATVIVGHLAVAATFTLVLLLAHAVLEYVSARPAAGVVDARALLAPSAGTPWPGGLSRRSAALMVGGTAAAYLATLLSDQLIPKSTLTRVVVRRPDELATPTPSSRVGERPKTAASSQPAATPATTAQPRPTATPPAWEPAPARVLKRDKDGAVLPSGRRPGELAELITSNEDFYIVTKNAAGDPVLDLSTWRLRIDGEVARPIQLDYASLRRLASVEVTKTLECISNFVDKCELAPFGCDLISTARWTGVRVSDVLALAGGLKPGVTALSTISQDEFVTALPIEAALDPETLLVYEMNGQVLPREHGYPLRMLVPGRYGMKNAKWIVALRPVRNEAADWYGQRNWSKEAIVKTMTRIDVPARGGVLVPGSHRVAGIAYAGVRGIKMVEYSADGGEQWRVAELLDRPLGSDAWVRWQGRFTLPPGGQVTLVARAIDGTGQLQPQPFSLPQPDGSSGWHTCEVRASS
jgi:DMSO/TMAO reductase YedYZ molybdopterin-dependent catalytic subunit